jgi:hypothetical protein
VADKDEMGSMEPAHKGEYTMALAKDKAKLAIAAVKSEDTQVKQPRVVRKYGYKDHYEPTKTLEEIRSLSSAQARSVLDAWLLSEASIRGSAQGGY